jgi:DNA-binding protein HU-beta
MTKADIVKRIAEKTGVDRYTALQVVESFMEEVKDALTEDENVYLRGFGSFIVKTRASKPARNITKKTTIIVAAHKLPAFKPAKVFKERVK